MQSYLFSFSHKATCSQNHSVLCGRATEVKLLNHICTSFNFTLTSLHTLAQAITPFTERERKREKKHLPANTRKDPEIAPKIQTVKISIALFMSTGQTDLTNLDDSINKRGGHRLPARHTGNMGAQWKT